jgi:hypothetical protein|tara:strand:- start:392 stop:592 length:201 start_codon:yes stop_codon:yes gene_type:complete
MTVKELMEKLSGLNPDDRIMIEVNHDDICQIVPERIVEDLVTDDGWNCTYACDEDMDAVKVVVIRV